MTSRELNDFLTQTGPGTPMGNLLRRYWIPALLSSRVRLRKAALAAQEGKDVDGLDPAAQAVRSAAIVLPESVSFHEAVADALEAQEGVAHTSV